MKFELEKTNVEQIEITKEDFEDYENVRISGVTNMFNIKLVSELSGLDRNKVMTIMKHYEELMIEYPGIRK